MTAKRWVAIITAAVLLIVSIGINTLSYFFTRDFNSLFDDIASQADGYGEEILEFGSSKDRIALVTLDGVIQDTGSASPFLSVGYNHRLFMNQLNDIYEDESIKGVVLSVNTPGGGVVESADIYDAIRLIQDEREVPVYVSMGGMAASGGYYVSAPADKIYVHPETITGSIGVIMENINFAKLAEKHGVEFNTIKTGPYKDIMSASREMTDEERDMLQEMLNDSYDRFINIIAEGREMSEKAVREVADGRILNGRQAIEVGLADDYGKVQDAIQALQEDHQLEDATVFEYTENDSFGSLFGVKMKSFFNSSAEQEVLSTILSEYHNTPRMLYLYGDY